jgi:hypothetical protein
MSRRTIGFFGDSFCAGPEPESWCVILAKKLEATITHWGEPGRSIWSTFINFKNYRLKRKLPDFIVFCYTEPFRLYHSKIVLSANTEPLPDVDPKVYKALDDYWIHLHNYEKDMLSYEYALKWFDHDVLSKITTDKTVVQCWSFRPFETCNTKIDFDLKSGIFIDESMYKLSVEDRPDLYKQGMPKPWIKDTTFNHMTAEQNEYWANKVYQRIKEYHEQQNRYKLS